MSSCFFFNDTATTEIYTLSLHDALPIWAITNPTGQQLDDAGGAVVSLLAVLLVAWLVAVPPGSSSLPWLNRAVRSGEHTSELQSRQYLVCRLLLEKKKKRL